MIWIFQSVHAKEFICLLHTEEIFQIFCPTTKRILFLVISISISKKYIISSQKKRFALK